MCYNFATFVLYLDVITLIYRENRLTSSETSLSAVESCKSKDLQDFFLFVLLSSPALGAPDKLLSTTIYSGKLPP